MKKRLLIFHPYLATYRIDVYNRLSKDYELEVLLTGAQAELDALGFNVAEVNARAEFKYTYFCDAKYIGRHPLSTIFWKKIRQFKPDIVLAHEYGINTIAAILAKPFFGYKLYLTCDDNVQMASSYSRTRAFLRQYVVSHVDGFVCVSPQTVDYLRGVFCHRKCRFMYFPIIQDDEVLAPRILEAMEKAYEYETAYGLTDKNVLLFVGRLEPVKCIRMVIDAFKSVCREDDRFIIVGSGSLERTLRKQVIDAKLSDTILFTGQLSDVNLYGWYHLAKLFVLASDHEAFGAVVNEALVAGCRVIVSDHCGSADLVTEENGRVFESGNQQQLEQIMEKEFSHLPREKSHTSKMPKSFSDFYRELTIFLGTDA